MFAGNSWAKKWRMQRAKGVILEYMRGVKPEATLTWCTGCLLGDLGLRDPEEVKSVIKSIESDPALIVTPERRERFEKLKAALKEKGMLSDD